MNNIMPKFNVILSVAIATSLLASCSLTPTPERSEEVHEVFDETKNAPLVIPDSVNADLMASNSNSVEMAVIEERFNVSANNVPVKPFLQGLVEDSPYSVAFHSGVEANVSLDLKDVTINEVMNVLTSLYPLDVQYHGKVIQIFPAKIKTETLAINYLMLKRFGMTSTSINSGGIVQQNGQNGQNGQSSQSGQNFGSSNSNSNQGSTQSGSSSMNNMGQSAGSNIQTTSESDFWQELEDTLKMIMSASSDDDNAVVISPQSGLITVRGFPSEIMAVKNFVKLSEESLTRQVVLEAKIVEVALDDNYKQGINWQNVLADKNGTDFAFNTSSSGSFGDEISAALGGVTSLTINNVDFGGVVSLLKTQGNVQVLSSPRVTATNNQKAVIKVGEDEYFVTDVSNTTVTGTATSSTPEINLEPFFSGIALDVTPQISEQGDVILHVHPSVTEIAEQQKVVTLNEEQYVLPLAKSNIRESDTVIRAKSGEIVVIGGLMQSAKTDEESRVPFLGAIPFLGNLFKSKQDSERKKELVILIRPTVVGTGTWKEQMQRSADVLNRWYGDK
ncbi:pilus (MSHA type) biogenesis protein MshL [Psychrosphaera sp. B3R10]|uniref:pilus (MSHA type) biogenesis protein MshL n=1 Tax=unclassified Psychrosphaera TaxID=2641570 RepID=UPI001C08BE93|nr:MULTISPECIES: pilus (MSHA type) biogenesis protein MshL [unclassified Psychrosphaera]MBU2882706.1 pilus (MSHA type) biogenesis protein MshL [Psychrosphaera sp. I2R16]MBU2989275.1 pilus (MSHA type) biogenesis protein MshL [Psychrosphaera sp. B3R10]